MLSKFPINENFCLIPQLQRATLSISNNIAEGCGRQGPAELNRFLNIALGSASELEYHFILAHDLGFIPDGEYERLAGNVIEVKQMLTGLIQKLKSDG